MEKISGTVEALFISNRGEKISEFRPRLYTSLEGIEGDKHAGFVRDSSGSREAEIFGRPKTEQRIRVANWRQWSAVSREEMNKLAEKLNIEQDDDTPAVLASLVGANILVRDIPNFSKLTPTSILVFPSGSLWMVIAENLPCIHPGHAIEAVYPKMKAAEFPKAALHIRGLVGNILLAGKVQIGDRFELRRR